jgi:hypothetical protein
MEQQTFDNRVLSAAEELAIKLLDNSEVNSVAVIVDWNLPQNVANALPVGIHKVRNSGASLRDVGSMQVQLARMMQHNLKSANDLVIQCIKKAGEVKKENNE